MLTGTHTRVLTPSHLTHTHTLLQWNVIGQNLADITDEDDLPTITKNLQSSTTPPFTHLDGRTELQHRQFFVRIKSSLTPGQHHVNIFALSTSHTHDHTCTHDHTPSQYAHCHTLTPRTQSQLLHNHLWTCCYMDTPLYCDSHLTHLTQ